MKRTLPKVCAALLAGALTLHAAETDLAWKWDASRRIEPAKAEATGAKSFIDTLFVMSAESTGGVCYLGLLLVFK